MGRGKLGEGRRGEVKDWDWGAEGGGEGKRMF